MSNGWNTFHYTITKHDRGGTGGEGKGVNTKVQEIKPMSDEQEKRTVHLPGTV